MKVKSQLIAGQRHFFIEPENNDEESFVQAFFDSPGELNEQLKINQKGKFSELVIWKDLS